MPTFIVGSYPNLPPVGRTGVEPAYPGQEWGRRPGWKL